MRFILTLLILLVATAHGQTNRIVVVKSEAKDAYRLLNEIRMNPEHYIGELQIGSVIQKVKRTELRWNNNLARVAERRALDMAQRNYFDHTDPDGIGPNHHIHRGGYKLNTDWLKRLDANNFESIAANHPTASDGIKAFIIGKSSPGFMHRKHMLGLDEWNASLVDIGIGFVRSPVGSKYKTYLCVLIAKHDW